MYFSESSQVNFDYQPGFETTDLGYLDTSIESPGKIKATPTPSLPLTERSQDTL